jgi:glutamine synthetase
VKIVDPSANPYLATAAILGLAIDGIENTATLPPEVVVDPHTLTEAERHGVGAVQLSAEQRDQIAALDHSSRLRTILGDSVIDALIAVRRYEQQNYAALDAVALADKFRLAWSL